MSALAEGYELVIGLEVHAQLRTATKIFCPCANGPSPAGDEAGPNRRVCPRCYGLPGALPTLSGQAVVLAVRAALALGCTVHRRSEFARKNYFYPDLPKGYQISQHDRPLATDGRLVVPLGVDGEAGERVIGVQRLHLEEDAGRSLHDPAGADHAGRTRLDFDRCGAPLIEIVSAPELASPDEAAAYLRALRALLRACGVSNASLELGEFRCDANLSLRRRGEPLGTRCEVKNLNSLRHVRQALQAEAVRQAELLGRGAPVLQQTRGFDPATGRTFALRSKEEAEDYRYFPEPDLPPLVLSEELIAAQAAALPELPRARRARYLAQHALAPADATVLAGEPALADYFEATLAAGAPARPAANWIKTELLRAWDGEHGVPPVTPAQLAALLDLLQRGALGGPAAKQIWEAMAGGDTRTPRALREALGLAPLDDLGPLVQQVLAEHPAEVGRYRAGKTGLLGFFVGQAVRLSGGRADANRLRELFVAALEGR